MIVRTSGNVLLLITQPDHAQLARQVMERCAPLARRARRESILLAIGEHDNGWAETDAAPIVDPNTGSIADFVSAPLRIRHEVWPRGVARLAADPWAAALVAQHAITVYDRYRPDPAWTTFFEEMTRARDAMLQASGLSLPELLDDYPFVRLGDLISLTFCTGWTEPQHFDAWTVRPSGPRLTVTPTAFNGDTLSISIRSRTIRNVHYQSDDELRAALRDPIATTLLGHVS